MQASDYAHARGAYASTSSTYAGDCWWWLRSPGSITFGAAIVSYNGIVNRYGSDVYYYYRACVPALHINLSSDLWFTADDGSSGDGGNGGTKDDRISSFRIDSSASGTINAPVTLSGSLELLDQAETSSSILQQEIDAITWTSSDSAIAKVTNVSASKSPDNRSASLSITVTPYAEGTATITGKTSTGRTASCDLTVKKRIASSFTIKKEAKGTVNRTIYVSGRLVLMDGVDISSDLLSSDGITWTSSNAGIAAVTDCLSVNSYDKRTAELLVYITPRQAGTATITGTTSDGQTAVCEVTVTSEEEDDSLESVTKTEKVKAEAYGIKTYEESKAGRAHDLAVQFCKALDDYLDAVKTSAQQDLKNMDGGEVKTAEELRRMDEATNDKMITINAGTKEPIINIVYEALAMYLEDYKEQGVSIGKIKLDDPYFKINVQIINKIRSSMDAGDFSRRIGKHSVQFQFYAKMSDAYAGYVFVDGAVVGSINSSAKKTAEVMTAYIQMLSDTVNDLYKEALKSVFAELSKVTGLADYRDQELQEFFKDKAEALQKNGYGNILKYANKLSDGYGLVKDIASAGKAENLQGTLRDAESIYKKLKSLDYSDESVQKASVNTAVNKINKIKGNLEDALYDYLYDGNHEQESFFSSFKKIFIQCPVDFTVYDAQGEAVGYVKDGEVWQSGDIRIEVSGDVKVLYVPENMQVDLQLSATDDGTMNYIIEEVNDDAASGRMNFYDVPLTEGKGYRQTIPAQPLSGSEESLPMESESGEKIFSDEYLSAADDASVIIYCEAEEGGTVVGGGSYPKGEPVELTAVPSDDRYEFCGWYCGSQLVELSSVYRFTARQNSSLLAKFQKRNRKSEDYNVLLGGQYEEFAWADIYENDASSQDIALRLYGAESMEEYGSLQVKQYDRKGTCQTDSIVITEQGTGFECWLRGVDLQNYAKTELYDGAGELIVCMENRKQMSSGGSGTNQGGNSSGSNTNTSKPSGGNKPNTGNSQNSTNITSKTSLTKATATLKKTSCAYNGKAQKPGVTVKLGSKQLTKDKDYKLTYKNNKKVGTASVIITGTGDYTGALTKTFKIVPKGTMVSGKIKAKSKGFTVSWKKQKSVTGYQLQYSTSKKFAKKATVTKTIKKKSATKWSSGKLKPNKIYYVRIRTYQTVKGKKYESAWSKAKTVKTRK
ncbi:MAG: hypothetical protein HFJ04_09915 [Lachnospiraceae bacterium]|nr:hypothetical protein [Lachnospiraceae bacterium]